MKLILIRAKDSPANSRLTSRGIEHANLMAEKMRKKEFQLAFKTSLSRSSDTMDIVFRYHPECQRVIVDDKLIERSYGDLERKYHKTVIKNFGKTQFALWHRS